MGIQNQLKEVDLRQMVELIGDTFKRVNIS